MHTHGLAASSVGLSSGSAGWAVAPAGFMGSRIRGGGGWLGPFFGPGWTSVNPPLCCRLGAGGFNFLVAVCAGRPPQVGGWGLRPVFPAAPSGEGQSCTVARVVAFSACVEGWCGGVPGLWACFFAFRGLRGLDWVRPTVSFPCLGAVVCLGVPCCSVLCFAVLRCAVLRPALPCRAVPCRAVSCLAVLWRVAPCCAVPRRVVLWCAVSRGAVPRCAALLCAVLQCAVLCCVVSCCSVFSCVLLCGGSVAPLGPAWGGVGTGQTGRSAVWIADSGDVAG